MTSVDTMDARRMSLLFLVLLVTASGNTAMHSLLPTIGTQMGINDVWVSLAFSWSALAWVFTAPMWARLSDQRGRKKLMHLGLAGFAGSMLLSGVVLYAGLSGLLTSIWAFVMFAVLRTLYGGLGSAAPPAVQAYVAARTSAAERTRALSLIASAFGLGTVLGPALAPYLMIDALGLASPMFVFALFGVATMVALAVMLPNDDPRFDARGVVTAEPFSTTPSSSSLMRAASRDAPPAPPRLSWFDARIRSWMLIGFVGGHASAMVFGVVGFLVMDRLGLRSSPGDAVEQIGIVLMAGAGATLLAQWGLIPLLKPGPRMLIVIGLLMGAAGAALTGYARGLLDIVLGFSLFSLGFGLFRPGFTAGASLAVTQAEQGGVAGMVSGITGATFVAAPALSVGLYTLHPALPFQVVIAGCLALALWARGRMPLADVVEDLPDTLADGAGEGDETLDDKPPAG